MLFDDGFKSKLDDMDDEWDTAADVLRLNGCQELELRLRDDANGISDRMNKKIFIVDNISKLKMTEFLVGVAPFSPDIGSVSTN